MKLYIRSRFPTRILFLYAFSLLMLALLGNAQLHLPSFVTAVSQATPVTVIIACGFSTISIFSLHGGYPLLEAQSARNIPALDLYTIASSVTIFYTLTLLTHGWIPALIILRALLGFTASALLITALTSQYIGTASPGILFIIFTLFGEKSNGSGKAWAFAIADIDTLFSWILVAILCLAGSYMWIRHYPLNSA